MPSSAVQLFFGVQVFVTALYEDYSWLAEELEHAAQAEEKARPGTQVTLVQFLTFFFYKTLILVYVYIFLLVRPNQI